MAEITLNTSAYPMDSEVVTTTDSDGNVTVSYDRAVDSAILRKLYSNLYTDGISPNDSSCLQVTSGDGMTVNVAPGFCILEGVLKLETATRNLAVQASNALYDRIDMVVMRLDDNRDVRTVDLYVLEGTAASTPSAPTLTRGESTYEIGVATLFISKNTTTISQERITDLRYDTDYCGVITSPSEFDTEFIYTQVQAALASFENDMSADFEEWYQSIKDQLSEDAAGNLQLQIDAIEEPEFAVAEVDEEDGSFDDIEQLESEESLFGLGKTILSKLSGWYHQIVKNKADIVTLNSNLDNSNTINTNALITTEYKSYTKIGKLVTYNMKFTANEELPIYTVIAYSIGETFEGAMRVVGFVSSSTEYTLNHTSSGFLQNLQVIPAGTTMYVNYSVICL